MNVNNVNSCRVNSNGYQIAIRRGKPQAKFDDLTSTSAVTSTGTILPGICNIAQGIGVTQRTGDTVYWEQLFLNYTINAQNSDVFSNCRVIVFQWHPSSAIAVPLVTDILQTASIYSQYDWQFSNQYAIIFDRVHFLSGTSTAPTVGGNQGFFGEIPLSDTVRKGEYAPAVTTGSQQYYILVISDSVIAPFPNYTGTTRIVYTQ